MKVLLINGSPRGKGNTYIALSEVAKALEANGVETEIVSIGTKAVQGCIACNRCAESGRCAFGDELYITIREKLETADGIIIGSPVYYAGPNGSLCALLDALQACSFRSRLSARRGKRHVRPAEQVFHDKQHARRKLPVLEQRSWPPAGRSLAGCRRITDDAHPGQQHGMDAEKPENRRSADAGKGAWNHDELYPIIL